MHTVFQGEVTINFDVVDEEKAASALVTPATILREMPIVYWSPSRADEKITLPTRRGVGNWQFRMMEGDRRVVVAKLNGTTVSGERSRGGSTLTAVAVAARIAR